MKNRSVKEVMLRRGYNGMWRVRGERRMNVVDVLSICV
jgi:hypothetical protein